VVLRLQESSTDPNDDGARMEFREEDDVMHDIQDEGVDESANEISNHIEVPAKEEVTLGEEVQTYDAFEGEEQGVSA
jgi:hypothetical protein